MLNSPYRVFTAFLGKVPAMKVLEVWSSLIRSDRPFGLNLIVTFISFVGAFYLVVLLTTLLLFNLLSTVTPFQLSLQMPAPALLDLAKTRTVHYTLIPVPDFNATVLLLAYFSLLAFGHLALARGLWLLKRWAYWGMILLESANILFSLQHSKNSLQLVTSLYIPVVILLYLLCVGRSFVRISRMVQVPEISGSFSGSRSGRGMQ